MVVEPGGVAPVSAVYLWFKAGTAHEPRGLWGGAHFLEHMLFKGSGGHGVGEVASEIESLGGDLNAFTSYEQTVLHATVPAGRERETLALLAEMALHPRLDPDEIEREKAVVVEEIRGSQDEAGQVLAEQIRARVYGSHPYGRPVLGTEASVRGLTPEALRRFHAQQLQPERAVVAVAGPVDPLIVAGQARELLGPAGGLPWEETPITPATPPGKRAFVLDRSFEEQLVELAFPAPDLAHEDQAALDLLVTALGAGESSLLSETIKRELGLAHDCWAALENERRGGLVVFGLVVREERLVEAAGALAALLGRVAREGIPAAALHRARQSVMAARVFDREVVDGRAHRLGWYEANFGDPARESAYEAAILRADAREIQAVAARWLDHERAVVGAVCPRRMLSGRRLGSAIEDGFSRRFAPAPAPTLRRATLSCGARVVARPDEGSELFSVSVVGVGGALAEGARSAGLADVWAAALARGVGGLSATELADAVAERGGSLAPWAWRSSAGITATFPAGELNGGLELLAEALVSPSFEPDEVERAREELDEARQTVEDAPSDLAWDLAWQLLYPGHPWGRPAHGTRAGLASATASRLRAYHRRVFCGENLVIALAGAVDTDRACRLLERRLGHLPKGAPFPWAPPALPDQLQRVRRRRVRRQQAQLVVAFPGAGWGTPEAAALALLESVLGGQGGRLFVELREKSGLAYDVGASSEEGLGGGTFLCALGTDPARAEEAWTSLWAVIDDLLAAPIDERELSRAKARVVEGAALDLQRSADRAAQLASAERYGPGAEHIDALMRAPAAVDAETLHAVASRVLRRDRCVMVQVGPR